MVPNHLKNTRLVATQDSDFFNTKQIHTAGPLHIARYVAFWPLAAMPAATIIFILAMGFHAYAVWLQVGSGTDADELSAVTPVSLATSHTWPLLSPFDERSGL